MNYNRFLDLHLCTKIKLKKPLHGNRCIFNHGGAPYYYDFNFDVGSQMMNRLGKNEGYGEGNSKILAGVEVTRLDDSLLKVANGEISKELERLRYLGCLVAIEHLQDATVYPQLQALMSWISDASMVNKLRVNCHGSGTSKGGFLMGGAELTPDQLVAALVRHGLTRDGRAKVKPGGTAHAARWKLDDEVTACEGCKTPFQKTWYGSSSKHHCRRCGGIFCERCSARTLDLDVALVGPDKPPAKNVKQARVCQTCFDTVRTNRIASFGLQPAGGVVHTSQNLDKYGLQTFTLALCMGAKSDSDFSEERSRKKGLSEAEARFVADSLAGRLVAALRQNNLRGIKVTASNQVVCNDRRGGQGIMNNSEITYPGGGGQTVSLNKGELLIPGLVWGMSKTAETNWNGLPDIQRPESGEITVGPNKTLEFGRVDHYHARAGLVKSVGDQLRQTAPSPFFNSEFSATWASLAPKLKTLGDFLKKWKFDSWNWKEDVCYSQTTRRANTSKTLRLTPPPRIERLEKGPTKDGKPTIKVIARAGNDMFKWFKSYEIS